MAKEVSLQRDLIFLAGVGLLLIFGFSGVRPIMDTSEARYVETAREMAVEGHWLVPHLEGHPHLTKPPLTYWLVAVPMALFGRSEFIARMGVGLFALLTVLMTAQLAARMYDSWTGLLAGWAQLLAVVPLVAANIVTTDTFLATFETAFMWCAWEVLTTSQKQGSRWRWWTVAAYVSLALAFLTKGPAGFAVPSALLVHAILARKHMPLKRFLWPPAVAVFFAVAAPWYIYVLATVPQAAQIWHEETVTKIFQKANHDFPRLGYVALLTLGALPATLALGYVVRDLRTQLRSPHLRPATTFALTWLIVPLVILSLQKTRLALYVLPLFPPVSILCGATLARHWRKSPVNDALGIPKWVGPTLAFYCGAFLIGKYVLSASTERWDPNRNFKPVAMAIRSDAAKMGMSPQPIIKENKLGHGLCFYLNLSDILRVGAERSRWAYSPRNFQEVLNSPLPRDRLQYFVVQTDKLNPLAINASDALTTISVNRAYTVLRRNL